MQRIIRSGRFSITVNKAFEQVIAACSKAPRPGQDGTWITADMQAAYIALNKKGHAHSVEIWEHGELVGGLYGVQVNSVFCGESMFSKANNASKAALVYLCQNGKYDLIDCQVYTPHLASMGARLIGRNEYMRALENISR